MKRTFYVATGALVLGMAIVYSATSWAQQPAPTAAPGQKTKVGMFNLTYVVKHYQKFAAFESDLKATMKGYETKHNEFVKKAEDLKASVTKPGVSPEQREAAEREMKNLQRLLEDNRAEGSKVLMKKQGDQLSILYKEVRDAVARYAAAHGYDVVLHYNDAITNEHYWSNENLARKMQAGALMPIYMGHGVDISQDLVRNLNAAMKPRAGGN